MVLTREVTLPAFEKGAYHRPFTKRNGAGGSIARGNRAEAVAFKSIADLPVFSGSPSRLVRRA